MSKLATAVDPASEAFSANAQLNRRLASELREQVARTALGGSETSRQRHTGRGKLLPRDRVERLLDVGSPFLELSQLAAFGMYDDEAPARDDHRHGPGVGPRVRDRGQRPDGEGRRLLSRLR
jgi:3-methylcrotonyl-CoA carboxylase beta subunit